MQRLHVGKGDLDVRFIGGWGVGAVVVVVGAAGFLAAGLRPTVVIAAVAVGCVAVVAVAGAVVVAGTMVTGATGVGAIEAIGVVSRAGTFSAFGYEPAIASFRSRGAKALTTRARMTPATMSAAVWRIVLWFMSIVRRSRVA